MGHEDVGIMNVEWLEWFRKYTVPVLAGMVLGAAAMFKGVAFFNERSDRAVDVRAQTLERESVSARSEVETLKKDLQASRVAMRAVNGKLMETQQALAAALDPARRCRPLYEHYLEKGREVAAKEARLPYAAPTAIRAVNASTPVDAFAESDAYHREQEAVEALKRQQADAESDWRACLRG
jgi:hypothetical protein